MKKYVVKQKKEKYIEVTIEAKNKEEAKRKVEEEEYRLSDVLEDEYLLPSSDWETISVEEIKNE